MTRKSVVLDLVQPESAGKAVLALSSEAPNEFDIKHQEGGPVRIRPAAMPYHVNWRQCSNTSGVRRESQHALWPRQACSRKERQGHHRKDTECRRHACRPQPEILVLLGDTVGMDNATRHKRKAKQMYEPRWPGLHLDESGEQHGQRDIFGEVRVNPDFSF